MAFAIFAFTLSLTACLYLSSARGGSDNLHQVQIYEGLTLGELLATPVATPSLTELEDLRAQRWYTSFTLAGPGSSRRERTVVSCVDYEVAFRQGLQLVDLSHRNALMELAVMCQAAKQLAAATPASHSFLQGLEVDDRLPKQLPAALALISSAEEAERLSADKSKAAWADVAPTLQRTQTGQYSASYYNDNDASEQQIQLIGRGDVDQDGIEDVLLVSRDSINQGSWFGLRLFVVTRLSIDGDIVFLQQYSLQ